MKRKIEISSTDGSVRLTLVAKVETDRTLTRVEGESIRDQWAERLMNTIPGLRYASHQLHRIKVKSA